MAIGSACATLTQVGAPNRSRVRNQTFAASSSCCAR
jgi:hypothetical protein